MVWIWLGPLIAVLSALVVAGLLSAMHEMNPDPGWRAREAEIRRLRQEKELKELRGED
jgi:hypothetical protein